MDLILPLQDKFGQISIAFGPKGIIGCFPQPGDYRIEPEKFYRVTVLVDSDEACGLLCFNDYIAFCPTLKRMGTLKPKYAAFGDGGRGVAGVFALRYLKLGAD